MKKKTILSILIFFILFVLFDPTEVNAQTVEIYKFKKGKTYAVEVVSGQVYAGKMLLENEEQLLIKTKRFGEVYIDKDSIKSVKEITSNPKKYLSIFSFGPGASLGFQMLKFLSDDINLSFGLVGGGPDYDRIKVSAGPVITGSFDQTFPQRFSVGFGISYQDFRATYKDSPYSPDVYTRTNYALRGFFNIKQTKELYLYCGWRMGYTLWGFSTQNPDPHYKEVVAIRNHPSFQVLFGLKYFLNKNPRNGFNNLGFGFEAALGTAPYFLNASICLRLGKREARVKS